MGESKRAPWLKLFFFLNFSLNQCLSRTHTIAEIQAVLPGNLEDLDHSVMAALFQKTLSHHAI
ncbi:Protein CBG24132 [Caenorhabditis briggsae]|uniref:Protein CBG24132 n=1 Tax=Caenorhabditis briggsae TaxID=6238 RepID=A8WK18_CAEBR|nr:Protein CBG24132 [Caenorhabditis briggsae]CAP20811.1 Protein CBG24132 [Caenorhabditis briggsae]